jgi:hypothetical protein
MAEFPHIKVIIAPNATQDLLSMQVFPTPALKPFDFGINDASQVPPVRIPINYFKLYF